MQSSGTGLHRARTRRQSGAVAMLGALWLMIAVICLATIDIGNVFWQKRELQKIADLAALAGASGVLDQSSCKGNSEKNVVLNGGVVPEITEAVAGRWDKNTSPFFALTNKSTEVNACKVSVKRSIPYFFLFAAGAGGREVSAQAIAVQSPRLAKLSVRSTLLALDTEKSALLDAVVGGLLGGKIKLDAVGWEGIAKANISLLSFLKSLNLNPDVGVALGDFNKLLKTDVTLSQIMSAVIQALPADGDLATIKALQAIKAGVGDISVKLGDIIKLGTGLGESALKTDINLLDFINAVAQVANKKNAVAAVANIDLKAVQVGLNLKVIEPAQISIGDPARDLIEAKTSQIDLNVGLKLNLALVGLGLSLDVKIGQGKAKVENYSCLPNKSLTIAGQTGVGSVILVGEVLVLPLPLVPEMKIPVSIKLPVKTIPIQRTVDDPPNLNQPAKWIVITQDNLVQSLISALTDALGPLGLIIGLVISPLTFVLDSLLNFLLSFLGIDLAKTEIGAQLNCFGNSVDLVY